MRHHKHIFSSIVTVILAAIILGGCHKDTGTAPVPMGQVWFHLHSNVDTSEIDTAAVVRDASGRQLKIKVAQFYASTIQLQKMDGSWYTIQGTYLLKTIGTESYYVGMAPAGNYLSVSFSIGLDPDRNLTDPASYTPGSIFAPQTPLMWFGSTSQGYIFMNVQGKADTSAANNGLVNVPISYQLGTNALLRKVTLPQRLFSVVPGTQTFVHMICDYGKLLTGINFKTQASSTPFSNPAVATQIANNIPGMVRYE